MKIACHDLVLESTPVIWVLCVKRWFLVDGSNEAEFGQGQAGSAIVHTSFEVQRPCSGRGNGGGAVSIRVAAARSSASHKRHPPYPRTLVVSSRSRVRP